MRKARPLTSRAALGLLALLTAVSSVAGAYHQHLTLEARPSLSVDAKPSHSAPAGPCLVCRAAREQAPAVEPHDTRGPVLDLSPLGAVPVLERDESVLADRASPRAPPASSATLSV